MEKKREKKERALVSCIYKKHPIEVPTSQPIEGGDLKGHFGVFKKEQRPLLWL